MLKNIPINFKWIFFYTLNREKREMVYLVQGKSLSFDLFKAFDSDIFLYFSPRKYLLCCMHAQHVLSYHEYHDLYYSFLSLFAVAKSAREAAKKYFFSGSTTKVLTPPTPRA